MFGLGLKSQAQGEINNLNDTRSELENYDLGDRFRGFITGVSQEDVQKKAKELVEKKINSNSAGLQGEINTIGGGYNLGFGDLNIRDNETIEKYNARLAGNKTKAGIASQYDMMENSDASLLKPGMSVGQIRGLASNLRDSNKEKAEGKVKAETERLEIRSDRIREEGATERAKIRSDDRAAQRADNKLTRDLAVLSGDRELAIAQINSDLADKRMDYDRETRRMDKRSAAIAQLMSGLGSLGGAFSL